MRKPLTIVGRGSEIRGSDVWTEFTSAGGTWTSTKTVPAFAAHGSCRTGTLRCLWPEQAFVDGAPQFQVAAAPGPGQFAVDGGRHLVMGTPPSGHLVEVTVRAQWLVAAADDVTVDGFGMRHAANDAQSGAISGDGTHARFVIRNAALSDAHGGVVSLANRDSLLLNTDVSRGGQLGVHGSGERAIFRANRIHHNNTEDFEPGWEAGAFKSVTSGQTVESNEVYLNDGPGVWYDIHATATTVRGNRVHHNNGIGIFYEISSGGRILDNVVWENGWSFTAWAWGTGILLSSSNTTEVSGNIVAWNADGIGVIAQNRADAPGPVAGNYVHDNVVVGTHQPGDKSDVILLGWLQDESLGIYDSGRNNRGANNGYWTDLVEPSYCRFQWDTCITTLAGFNATPGEEGGYYLTRDGANEALAAAGVPTIPQPH